MTPLGIIVTAPFIPRLIRRVGAWRLAFVCLLLAALLFLAIGLYRNLWFWFPARFVLGASIDIVYVISETWLLQLGTDENRGKLIGGYVTMMAAGFMVGPFVLAATGSEGFAGFGFGISVILLTAIVLLTLRGRVPASTTEKYGSVGEFARRAPDLMLAVGVVALFDQICLSLLPVYFLSGGMSESNAAIALGVLIAGNVVLQLPIGWLTDRFAPASVKTGLTVTSLVCAVLLPFAVNTAALWPLLFVLGSSGFGIYTVVLAELGQRFTGIMLLAGNAGFALMWGIGGIIGPPASGAAMSTVGANGVPATLVIAFTVLLLAGWLRRTPGISKPEV